MSEPVGFERFPRRTLRRERTRARILAAATAQFRESGYGATTMQAIAEAADIHVTTLFTHFKSKRDLAISLTDASIRKLAVLIEAAKGTVLFFDFFRRIVLATARSIKNETDPNMTLWHELRKDPELAFAWAAYEQNQIDLFADYIRHDFKIADPDDYTPVLVAGLMVSSTLISHRRWSEAATVRNIEQETLMALDVAEAMAKGHLSGKVKPLRKPAAKPA